MFANSVNFFINLDTNFEKKNLFGSSYFYVSISSLHFNFENLLSLADLLFPFEVKLSCHIKFNRWKKNFSTPTVAKSSKFFNFLKMFFNGYLLCKELF